MKDRISMRYVSREDILPPELSRHSGRSVGLQKEDTSNLFSTCDTALQRNTNFAIFPASFPRLNRTRKSRVTAEIVNFAGRLSIFQSVTA